MSNCEETPTIRVDYCVIKNPRSRDMETLFGHVTIPGMTADQGFIPGAETIIQNAIRAKHPGWHIQGYALNRKHSTPRPDASQTTEQGDPDK